jgi:hypothetical protein
LWRGEEGIILGVRDIKWRESIDGELEGRADMMLSKRKKVESED